MKMTKPYLNDLTYEVVGAAIEVHRTLGPGLLEPVYHKCLAQELFLRKIKFQSEFIIPIAYKGIEVAANLRCDFVIENALVVELKAVEKIIPLYEAQLMSYMKLLKSPKGLLINFNVTHLFRDGQKNFVNDLFRQLPE
jgi:GxxExxY protein